jgi:hypothetical protein
MNSELEKTVRHLDLLHQFAIQAAEKECPGFTKSLENLTAKLEKLQKGNRP